jgi:hypothetical protein
MNPSPVAYLFLAAALLGCANTPPPTKLNFTQVGFVEERTPMPVGLVVENRGIEPVQVDKVQLQLDNHFVMTTAAESPISRLSLGVILLDPHIDTDGGASALAEGQTIAVQPGESATLRCMLLWQELKGDEAPMALMLRGTFLLTHGEEELAQTEPLLFVLQNREGATDKLLGGGDANWRRWWLDIASLAKGQVQQSPMADRFLKAFEERGLSPKKMAF